MPAAVSRGGAADVGDVPVPARGRTTCWSRSRTAGSAAPTCTSSSRAGAGPAPSRATSGRARSPPWAPTCPRGGGDAVVGGPDPRAAALPRPAAAGRPSLCAERTTSGAAVTRGPSPATSRARAEAPRPARGLSLARGGAGRTARRRPPRHRPRRRAARPPGAGVRRRPHRRPVRRRPAGPGRRRPHRRRAAPPRQALAVDLGAAEVLAPDDLARARRRHPGSVVDGAVDVGHRVLGQRRRAMEAALGQLRRGGRWCWSAPASTHRSSTPTGSCSTSWSSPAPSSTAPTAWPRPLRLLASGLLPVDHLLEPADVPLTGAVDAMQALAGGELAGKVLVAP